jgi:hypothetical protein
MSGTWLKPKQIATDTGRGLSRITEALRAGHLHGHQRSAGCTWRVHSDCVEAWLLAPLDQAAEDSAAACPAPQCRARRAEVMPRPRAGARSLQAVPATS